MKLFSISDLHPGRWLGGEEETKRALYLLAERALDEKVDRVIVNGDYSEELLLSRKEIDPAVYRRQCRTVGKVFRLLNGTADVEMVPGNHDDLRQLEEERLRELFNEDSIRFVPRPAVMRPHEDVAVTHGHLLAGARSVRSLIDDALKTGDREGLVRRINGSPQASFDEVRNPRHGAWEIVSRGQRVLKTIPGYEQMTEGRVIPALRTALKRREQERHERMEADALRAMGGKASMTDSAAHLGAALGTPVTLVGHDHLYGIAKRRVFDPLRDDWKTVYVANTGDYIGRGRFKGAAIVDTESRSVDLLRYDAGMKKVVSDQHAAYRV